jgi:Ca2+-binding RTX toxin-like protein
MLGNDSFAGNGGLDALFGGDGGDVLSGGAGGDTLGGGTGNDTLTGGFGPDMLDGGGDDQLTDDEAFFADYRDRLSGGDGDDAIISYGGPDIIDGGAGDDKAVITRSFSGTGPLSFLMTATGTATLLVGDGASVINVEHIHLTGPAIGNHHFRTLGGSDMLTGHNGNDTLEGGGTDTLTGNSGNDRLTGGLGADLLGGRAGNDTFYFMAAEESGLAAASRDTISDFTHLSDVIDLSAIDAIAGGADDAFSFIGTAAFTAAGQARAVQAGANTLLQVNTLGAGGAEMTILLANVTATSLTAADFVL